MKKENMADEIKQKKNYPTIPEDAQKLYLLGKEFKSSVLNVLTKLKENMDKKT